MSIAPTVARYRLGLWSTGSLMTPEEFDAAEFEEGWRYQLINEVLIVSPSSLPQERDPNQELRSMLRVYGHDHPQGSSLDVTLSEETVYTTPNRRRADRVIWAGLGRLPTPDDPLTIIVEFVSEGRANRRRDYETNRAEDRALGVREDWIFDRFERTLTVVVFGPNGDQMRVLRRTRPTPRRFCPDSSFPLSAFSPWPTAGRNAWRNRERAEQRAFGSAVLRA